MDSILNLQQIVYLIQLVISMIQSSGLDLEDGMSKSFTELKICNYIDYFTKFRFTGCC